MIAEIICILLISSLSSINGQEKEPDQINAEIGQEQVLECPETISLGKNCTWSHTEGPLMETDEIYQFINSTRCGLRIKIKEEHDDDIFICSTANNKKHKFKITTFKTPEINYIEYNGKPYSHSTKVLYEQNVNNVACVSKGGKPQPEIAWRINGQPQSEVSSYKTEKDTVKSELTFAIPPMSYSYITNTSIEVEIDCQIRYKGTKNLETINVSIVVGPQWDVTKVEIRRDGNNLTCSADGNPTPSEYRIQKQKEDGKWDDGYKITKDNPVFTVSEEGRYRCLVKDVTFFYKQKTKKKPSKGQIVSNALAITFADLMVAASKNDIAACRCSTGTILLLVIVALIPKMIDSI